MKTGTKNIVILAFLIVLCMGCHAFAQGLELEVMPIVKTGAIFTAGGSTEFGFAAGGNINLYRDAEKGFASYTYIGKFFNGRGEAQFERNTFFVCIEKFFPDFKGDFKPYVALGAGYVNEGNSAYMLDIGGVIYQKVGLSFSTWYAPKLDEAFVSLNINLTP